MNATNDRFKDKQLHNEDYLQMVSTESKEYAEVSACQRIAENNRIITDFQTDRLLEKTLQPTNLNNALDGMEALLLNKYSTSSTGRFNPNYNKHKVHLCRYADDFIVTADTCEILEDVKDIIQGFLAERGLELSKEKIVITKIEDGFDFLGWNFRKFKGKLLIQPSRKSKKKVMKRLSQTIKNHSQSKQEVLIARLNEIMRRWTGNGI